MACPGKSIKPNCLLINTSMRLCKHGNNICTVAHASMYVHMYCCLRINLIMAMRKYKIQKRQMLATFCIVRIYCILPKCATPSVRVWVFFVRVRATFTQVQKFPKHKS